MIQTGDSLIMIAEPGQDDVPMDPSSEVQPERAKIDLPSDAQICQWMHEASQTKVQRYWGETLTCPSIYQLRKNAHFYRNQKSKETETT